MKMSLRLKLPVISTSILILALLCTGLSAPLARNTDIHLQPIGTFRTGIFDGGAAEIVAHDPRTQRIFIINAENASVDVIDISNPSAPLFLFAIDVSPFGDQANSIAVNRGEVAVAVEADVKTDPGKVVFFDANGNFLSAVTVGALPDMLTYTPNGQKVLVANEGEPNSYNQADSVDPEGSVSIIDVKGGAKRVTQANVVTAKFIKINPATLDPSIRIFGPGATVAQDLEPEYIAVSHDSRTAWVTLQEANAMAVLDINRGIFTRIIGLGFKNHLLSGNGFDGSDRDGAGNSPSIKIANWPVLGMYQPDAIASFRQAGKTYLIMANEGDARDYDGFAEEARVSSLNLDPTAFPNAATLKTNAQIGRLTVTTATGDIDKDGDFDQLYLFGGRSFSIRRETGEMVFDSGDQIEQITAALDPANFNSNNDENGTFDTRSDNKGPEPEGLTIAELFGCTFAFIGLERIGGVMVYDITDPANPRFIEYINNRDFSGDPEADTAGDLGPEGLIFIPASESPNHKPLLVVANEISGSTTIYEISKVD